jgi:hypothetical protein
VTAPEEPDLPSEQPPPAVLPTPVEPSVTEAVRATAPEEPDPPGEQPPPAVLPAPVEQSVTEVVLVETTVAQSARRETAETSPIIGMNTNDLVGYAISSEERTKRLERLIWSVTGILALIFGSVSAIVLIASPYRVVGGVGLAAAGIAGVHSVGMMLRWIRQHWRRNKPDA